MVAKAYEKEAAFEAYLGAAFEANLGAAFGAVVEHFVDKAVVVCQPEEMGVGQVAEGVALKLTWVAFALLEQMNQETRSLEALQLQYPGLFLRFEPTRVQMVRES